MMPIAPAPFKETAVVRQDYARCNTKRLNAESGRPYEHYLLWVDCSS